MTLTIQNSKPILQFLQELSNIAVDFESLDSIAKSPASKIKDRVA